MKALHLFHLISSRKLKNAIKSADAVFCGTTKTEIESLLNNYFYGEDRREHFRNIEEDKNFALATALDPRFKLTVNSITLLKYMSQNPKKSKNFSSSQRKPQRYTANIY